jgi:hypothetical protein
MEVLAERNHFGSPLRGFPRLHPPPQKVISGPLAPDDQGLRVGRVGRDHLALDPQAIRNRAPE